MNNPKKRSSKILTELKNNSRSLESRRTRISMLLAAQIIKGLAKKGWNKLKLAEEMKKSPSVITRWLSGTHNFTSDTLSDIEEVLGIQLLNPGSDEVKQTLIVKPASQIINLKINLSNTEYYPEKQEGESIPLKTISRGAQPVKTTIANLN